MENKIICAAVKLSSGRIICGVLRHDRLMNELISALGESCENEVQGFVDRFGNFLTREEAFKVAASANQILVE